MRTLTDSTGVTWTVFEVKRQGTEVQWSYLPEEFGEGWLCFESAVTKRRLTPIPIRWRELSDEELERMLQRAQIANRPNRDSVDRPTAG